MGKAGEFVEAALVFDGVVGGDFDLDAGGDEGDEFSNGDAGHAEAEVFPFGAGGLVGGGGGRCGRGGGVRVCRGRGSCGGEGGRWAGGGGFCDGGVVVVAGDDGVVDGAGDVVEDFEGGLRVDVEEFAVLADAEVGEAIDGFVDEFFDFGVFLRFHRGEDVEGQGDGGVVEFFGADVDGACAFADFDPVFAEAGVGEDVDVPFFVVRHDVVEVVLRRRGERLVPEWLDCTLLRAFCQTGSCVLRVGRADFCGVLMRAGALCLTAGRPDGLCGGC